MSREALDLSPWPACVLDRGGIIVDVNAAWDVVAGASGGPSGELVRATGWLGHIAGLELRAWYAALLARVLSPSGEVEVQRGDCNTPTRFRLFSSRFEPLWQPPWHAPVGMLVTTTLLEDWPVQVRYQTALPDEARYVGEGSIVMQCSGCRRVRVAASPRVWEFVPEYVASPRSDVSHGLCPRCREVYYPGLRLRRTAA